MLLTLKKNTANSTLDQQPTPKLYHPEVTPYDFEMYRMVMHTPQEDKDHWHTHIKKRYLKQMLQYTPVALAKALFAREYNMVTNAEVGDFYWKSPFGRWLRSVSEEELQEWEVEATGQKTWLMASYNAMGEVHTFKNMYSAAVHGLFLKQNKQVILKGIKVRDEYFYPSDGMKWEVAKCYLLQGAVYHLVILDHPRVHLPQDTFIGHTFTHLPANHIIRKILTQHAEFSLEVNAAVVHSPQSIINSEAHLPYTGLLGEKDNFIRFISLGYTGQEEWAGYEQYQFELEPSPMHTDYYQYQKAYYEVMVDFTSQVLKDQNFEADADLANWAAAIGRDLPGFAKVYSLENLPKIIAKIIWSASIEHAADHCSFSRIPVSKLFMRLRVPPPSHQDNTTYKYKNIRWRKDYFKHIMAWKMYFSPNNVTLLNNVDYGFTCPKKQQLNQQFLLNLQAVEQQLEDRGIYIYERLENISCSIQY